MQVKNLVRTTDLKKTFSKGDITTWSYKLYKITEIFDDTMPRFKNDSLKERYNEVLLKKAELSLEDNKDVVKKLNLNEIKLALAIAGSRYLFNR